jgi:hypothetical protein
MRGRARGAAMVEAVVMLPVLVLLLVSVRFVASRKAAAQAALAAARECALQHALGGCEGVPPGCTAALQLAPRPSERGPAGRARLRLDAASSSLVPLSGVPALSAAWAALGGASSEAAASMAAPSSPAHGRDDGRIDARAAFPCSERPHDDDLAGEVFRAVTGRFFGAR